MALQSLFFGALLALDQADRLGVGLNCRAELLKSFQTIADANLSNEGLTLQPIVLFEVSQCLFEVLLKEQRLSSGKVRIRIVLEKLYTSVQILDGIC